MRTWAQSAAKAVMLTVTFAAAGACVAGAAFAGTPASSAPAGSGSASGNGSIGGGDQAGVPVGVPADVCGNAAAVLGDSAAGCEGTATARSSGSPGRPQELQASGTGFARVPGIDAVTRRSGARGGNRGRRLRGMDTPRQGTAMLRSPAYQGAERGLAVLGAPGVPAGTPDLTDLAAPSAAGGLPAGGAAVRNAMPASSLAAETAPGVGATTAPGMGSASFYSLAIGALMAGAVALKMAGRRIRGRKG